MNWYTYEKLRQLEVERLSHAKPQLESTPPRRKPIFGPLAAGAGRALRRFGEGLESWANVPPPHEDNSMPQMR
jgi:hypothetical protein